MSMSGTPQLNRYISFLIPKAVCLITISRIIIFSKSGTVCLSGSITKNMDYYIDNNEYSSDKKCLSQNPSTENEVNLYWTVKIVDSKINEVWVYTIPLEQNQLKRYTFQEQVNMVPLFGDEEFEYKSEYVIGYYTAEACNSL